MMNRQLIWQLLDLAPDGYMLSFERLPGRLGHFTRGRMTSCGQSCDALSVGHVPNIGEDYELCPACNAARQPAQLEGSV